MSLGFGSPGSSVTSLGTFGSPPDSVACSDTLVFGHIDTTAYQYDCDVIDDFTLVNGEKLK